LRIFRDNEWVEDIGRGQTPISVKVKHPEIDHTVRGQDFERWLEDHPTLTHRDGFEKSSARAPRQGQLILRTSRRDGVFTSWGLLSALRALMVEAP